MDHYILSTFACCFTSLLHQTHFVLCRVPKGEALGNVSVGFCRVDAVHVIQSNPMSITEADQGPLFPALSKNLKYKTQINSN